MRRILFIHGPNLNLLGEREPEIYGHLTLEQVNEQIAAFAAKCEVEPIFFQSNHEGHLVDFLHAHRRDAAGIVINAGALTHYSYALRDAIEAVRLPAVEVHLSDIHRREAFRHVSVIREICLAQISGLGVESYRRGLEVILGFLDRNEFQKLLRTTRSADEAYRAGVKILK